MILYDFIPAFQRFILYEKNLSSSYLKNVLSVVKLLDEYTQFDSLKNFNSDVISEFLQTKREQCHWSPKTLRNYRQSLKTFFDYLVYKQYFKTNPVDAIPKPKHPKNLPRCLTKQQTEKLITTLYSSSWTYPLEYYRNTAIILTFLYTGLRMSELLNLKKQDVNFEERSLYVHQGKGRKDRYIPLHPKLIPVLKFYLKNRNERLPISAYFFTSVRSTKSLRPKNLYAVFKKISCTCGFHITPHMLRHTMAKLSLEANLNPYTLKEILGHSHIATTQIYMSISMQKTKEQFNRLDLF